MAVRQTELGCLFATDRSFKVFYEWWLVNKKPEASCLFASDRSLKVCYDRSLANKQLASVRDKNISFPC